MSTTTPVPTTPKVRTYAADLTATRTERGLTTAVTPAVKTVITEKPAAVTMPTKKPVVASTPIPPKTTPPQPAPITKKVPSTFVTPQVTVPAAPSTTIEKSNPPFHTLSKSGRATTTPAVARIDTTEFDAVAKVNKPSVLANPGVEPLTVSRTNTSNTGTIITDTKQNHVSFLSAFATTITGWWHTKQKVAADRKQPKYTVPDAERRKGVIQKATTQTGRISTADHAAVVSRIKAAKMTPRGTPLPRVSTVPLVAVVPVAPKVAVQTNSGWSTETTQSEATDSIPAVVDTVQVTRIQNEIDELDTSLSVVAPTPAPRAVITPTIPVVPTAPQENTPAETITEDTEVALVRTVPETAPVVPFERARIVPVVPTAATTPAPQNDDAISEETTIQEIAEPDEILPASAATPQPNWSLVLQQRTSTNLFTSATAILQKQWWKEMFRATNNLMLAAALGCGVVVVGWYGMQAILAHKSIDTVVAAAPTTIFTDSALLTPTNQVRTKQDVIEALKSGEQGNESIVEISLSDTKKTSSPTPQTIFTSLQTMVTADFSSSLSRVVVGNYRTEPWMTLITTDTATAQGGMLVWEKTMSTDLSPWFGTAVQRNTKVGLTPFKDGSIAGHDVRILTDDKGTERIIYGFIAPNILLITTNTTAFLNLSQKVNK
jgi:hypothetical protein